MSSSSTVTAAVGFIDLATYSELESFLYGGPLAVSYFVAGVQKANWFTLVPVQLRGSGAFNFGMEGVSSSLNRSADYVLNVWFRCEIPSLAPTVAGAPTDSCRWTRNLMHNLIKKCSITFNDLIVEEFDNYWLDFNYMFRCPANKRTAYKNMIGDVSSLTTCLDGTGTAATFKTGATLGLYGGFFSVVLPFWFGEDSGVALPTAALPFNDIKINYEFRRAEELLVFKGALTIAGLTAIEPGFMATADTPNQTTLSTGAVNFRYGNTFAHYAVIHNDERTKMGDAPRDMLIRQVQSVPVADIPATASTYTFDVRLSHSIVQFFFALRNKTQAGEWSNYSTNFDYQVAHTTAPNPVSQGGVASPFVHLAPISHTQVVYENTSRLDADLDFFSLIHPYIFSDAVPDEVGFNTWSYSLKPWDPLSPAGSTNFSKLANVSITHTISPTARYFLANNLGGGIATPLKLANVFLANNWNIGRVANGSFGHPTL